MPDQRQPDRRRPTPLSLLRELARMFSGRAREVEVKGPASAEQPKAVPSKLAWDGVPLQLPADGFGPLFHRRYQVDIDGPRLGAEELMAEIQRDLAAFAPSELADFKKVKGAPGRLAVGDEYDITILGPWNGSVAVADVEPTSFTLVTLQGHPEAGQIRFQIMPHPQQRGALRFQILSWARSRDMLVGLSYNEGKLGKEVQKNAWVSFCETVVGGSGGRQIGEIDVVTEEREFEGEVVPLE
jgi:hypothetical protein